MLTACRTGARAACDFSKIQKNAKNAKNSFCSEWTLDFGTPCTWSNKRFLGFLARKTVSLCANQQATSTRSQRSCFCNEKWPLQNSKIQRPMTIKTPSSSRSQNAHISSHARATRLSIFHFVVLMSTTNWQTDSLVAQFYLCEKKISGKISKKINENAK